VEHPGEYNWSSYGANARGERNWLVHHTEYLRLGGTPEERCQAYRELFGSQVPDEDLHLIRKAAHYCQPVSDERFRRQVEAKYGIRLGQSKRGRPKQRAANN